MKTVFIAIVLMIFSFAKAADADDKLYFYFECSGDQDCIDLVQPNGKIFSVNAAPVLEISKKNILSVHAQYRLLNNYLLNIELDKLSAGKLTTLSKENAGKKLIASFNNEILGFSYCRETADRGIFSLTIGPVPEITSGSPLKEIPFFKDFIVDSNLKQWRALKNKYKIFMIIFILAWVYVLFPKIKKWPGSLCSCIKDGLSPGPEWTSKK